MTANEIAKMLRNALAAHPNDAMAALRSLLEQLESLGPTPVDIGTPFYPYRDPVFVPQDTQPMLPSPPFPVCMCPSGMEWRCMIWNCPRLPKFHQPPTC